VGDGTGRPRATSRKAREALHCMALLRHSRLSRDSIMSWSQKRQGPAGTGPASHSHQPLQRNSTTTMQPIDRLLPLLRDVRSTGRNSWAASCPNGHAHKGGLAITEAEDGRLLLHCFKGCGAREVLHAVGLELADLFLERIADPTPYARRAAGEAFKRAAWAAALGVLGREASVCLIAARDVLAGRLLSAEDAERLAVAVNRIGQAREVLL
jgi:hypothetical protein